MEILIAAAESVSWRLLEATLVRLGHSVAAFNDGPQALAALLEPDGPRLAILDWTMPGADGLEVCRQVRQRSDPYVYVILLTSPNRHEDMAAGLAAGADDFLKKPFDTVELAARLRSAERVIALQERLRHEATHDQLTGLWNRRMILDHLDRELSRAAREQTPLSVLIADLDHFKQVNDTHGHQAGDAVLIEAASRLPSVLRTYDAMGRYGGEEFLIVLANCTLDMAMQIANRGRLAVGQEPVRAAGLDLSITVSVGVAWSETGDDTAGRLIQAADDALYRAKAARNRVSRAPRPGEHVTPLVSISEYAVTSGSQTRLPYAPGPGRRFTSS
jgi:two-component system chemotaxis response regulator CheY